MVGFLKKTRSVCPVCIKQVEADLVQKVDGIYMEKTCSVHGRFSVPVWRDRLDFRQWSGDLPAVRSGENLLCPDGCSRCTEHQQGSCCVLLEVTSRCNLYCPVCFARAGSDQEEGSEANAGHDPGIDEMKQAIDKILEAEDKPLIQFTGGEPTLRDDLPELISYARSKGCRYTQLNTNGVRLAEDEAYVRSLAEAGLSFVFMQFDGVDDKVYKALRGRPLYETKIAAVRMCDRYSIGVTLVPTLVPGVNDAQIGEIIRLGASLSPAVRGIHFQPVAYLGRYRELPNDNGRLTLDELVGEICQKANLDAANLLPSRCDHPFCGFHGSYLVRGDTLIPLSHAESVDSATVTTAKQNREYIASRWERQDAAEDSAGDQARADETVKESSCAGEGGADSEGADCGGAGYEGADCENAVCENAVCEGAGCEGADFEDADCEDADCEDVGCENAGCENADCDADEYETFDGFLDGIRRHGFTITAMVFQDAMNLDIERLRRCSLHVYHEGALTPFCARYLTPMEEK